MPKEMLIWHKQILKSEIGYKSRPNDRFGFICAEGRGAPVGGGAMGRRLLSGA